SGTGVASGTAYVNVWRIRSGSATRTAEPALVKSGTRAVRRRRRPRRARRRASAAPDEGEDEVQVSVVVGVAAHEVGVVDAVEVRNVAVLAGRPLIGVGRDAQ